MLFVDIAAVVCMRCFCVVTSLSHVAASLPRARLTWCAVLAYLLDVVAAISSRCSNTVVYDVSKSSQPGGVSVEEISPIFSLHDREMGQEQ